MTGETRPRLSRKARLKLDPIDKNHVLLAPERGMVLNPSAAEILARCDGERTVDRIAEELSRQTDAPLDGVRRDVVAFLEEMAKRGLVEWVELA
jgi:coenzyme PQQ biosynthesis protein PqqD